MENTTDLHQTTSFLINMHIAWSKCKETFSHVSKFYQKMWSTLTHSKNWVSHPFKGSHANKLFTRSWTTRIILFIQRPQTAQWRRRKNHNLIVINKMYVVYTRAKRVVRCHLKIYKKTDLSKNMFKNHLGCSQVFKARSVWAFKS